MSKKAKTNAYEKVTAEMIKALEAGVVPWKKPWNIVGGLMPVNVANKKAYRGINVMILAWQDYESHVWGTFKQWEAKGGTVKKGEKATCICFWKFLQKKDENGNVEYDNRGREKKIPLLRYYYVFNACQVDGIDMDKYTPKKGETVEFNPIELAEQMVAEMPNKPTMEHGGNRASYSPSLDRVRMPTKEQFHSSEEYYSTLFHELGHSTGHDSRVGRDLSPTHFGSESYSKEELIAEMTACFLCSDCGITQTFENSAGYLQGWIEKLKGDPKLIVHAASGAKRAAEYITNAKAKAEAEKVKTETEAVA